MHINVSIFLVLCIVIFSISIDCHRRTVHVSVLKDDIRPSRNVQKLVKDRNQEQGVENSDTIESTPSYLQEDWRTLNREEYDQLISDLERITNRFLTHISIIEAYEQGYPKGNHSLEMRLAFDPFEWQLLSRLGPIVKLAEGELGIAGLDSVDVEVFLRLLDSAEQTGHALLFSKDSASRIHKMLAIIMRKLIFMDSETFVSVIKPIPKADIQRGIVSSLLSTEIDE